MRALSLCQSCKRHIRATESACPFCGAAFTPAPQPQGLKPRGRPGGRAALFLMGAAAAPGCVDEPEPEEQAMAVYGAPIDPDASSRAPDGGAARDAGSDARDQMAVPVYGVAVYGVPVDRDGGRDANVCGDPAPMPAPVYGVAIDGGAPRDADSDAGACGSDSATRDASTRDGEVLATPVYGLWLESEPEE